jgi:hypothetical protein
MSLERQLNDTKPVPYDSIPLLPDIAERTNLPTMCTAGATGLPDEIQAVKRRAIALARVRQ